MAAATAHEGAESKDSSSSADSRVAWCFFFQAPGAMLPYLLALPLLPLPKAEWTTSVQFRLILACGALVAMVPLVAAFYSSDTVVKVEPFSAEVQVDSSSIEALDVVPPVMQSFTSVVEQEDNKNVDTLKDTSRLLSGRNLTSPRQSGAVTVSEPLGSNGMHANWMTLIGTGGEMECI